MPYNILNNSLQNKKHYTLFSSSFHIVLIIITFLIANAYTKQQIHKLKLTQIQQQKYALKAEITNLNINIVAHLSDQIDWIKQDGCTVCQKQQKQQNNIKIKQKCQKSCFADSQYGIKCSKSYCKILSQKNNNLPYFIKQGTKVSLNMKQAQTGTKIVLYQTILAQKLTHNYPQIGRINLLNGNKGLFGNQIMIVKNHDKDITLYYYGKIQQQQQQEINEKDKKQNKNKKDNIKKQKQQKHKKQALYKDIKLLQQPKNNNQQIQGIVIESNLQAIANQDKTHKNKKQKQQNKQTVVKSLQQQQQQQDEQQQQQDEQQVNVFEISQIKLRQLFKQQNTTNNKKESLTKSQYSSQIPLIKTNTQFSLKTNKLILPPLLYKKLTKLIIDKYFSLSQKQKNNKNQCEFDNNILKCANKQLLKLQKINNVTITLTINGRQIQFPMRALIESCSQKSCKFLIGISKNKKQLIIGDFIFNIFAIKYQKHQNRWVLYRLNNQWAQNFKQFRKYSQKQTSFFWMLFLLIFYAIWWIFKIILFLSFIALCLNCIVHWKQVFNWFMQICIKLQKKQVRQKFAQNNIKNIRNIKKGIGKGINKMKIRIKDRFKDAMNRNKIGYDLAHGVEFQSQQFDDFDREQNKQNKQLMSVNDLEDRESQEQNQEQFQHQLINNQNKHQNKHKHRIFDNLPHKIVKPEQKISQPQIKQQKQAIKQTIQTKIFTNQFPKLQQKPIQNQSLKKQQKQFSIQKQTDKSKQTINTTTISQNDKKSKQQIKNTFEQFANQQTFYQFGNNESQFQKF